jgi:hypothetical protein
LTPEHLAVAVLASTFVLGVRSTWRLWRLHRGEDQSPRNLITGAFVTVAFVVTLAAGYYGFLSARRVLGFEPLPGAALVSVLVAAVVLLIPSFLDWTVGRIRSRA